MHTIGMSGRNGRKDGCASGFDRNEWEEWWGGWMDVEERIGISGRNGVNASDK